MTTLQAPKGQFRVVGVDTFDDTDWVSGDFATLEKALAAAEKEGGTMLMTHVYDDTGAHRGNYGSF